MRSLQRKGSAFGKCIHTGTQPLNHTVLIPSISDFDVLDLVTTCTHGSTASQRPALRLLLI